MSQDDELNVLFYCLNNLYRKQINFQQAIQNKIGNMEYGTP